MLERETGGLRTDFACLQPSSCAGNVEGCQPTWFIGESTRKAAVLEDMYKNKPEPNPNRPHVLVSAEHDQDLRQQYINETDQLHATSCR